MTNAAFIIGAGPRIGFAVAQALKRQGFAVAVGSRHPDTAKAQSAGLVPVKIDAGDAKSVDSAFSEVKSKIGIPNVVVYNAAALTVSSDDDPLSLSDEAFLDDLKVNTIGAYASLRNAVAGFHLLGSGDTPRVFIATGNVLPFQPWPLGVSLGAGKAALVHLLQVGTLSYNKKGYRFYFVSQVSENGGPVAYEKVDGEAHAQKYLELINQKDQGDWDVRFQS